MEDPDPDLETIAYALSKQCRYNGQTNRHWSVAQHQLLCVKLARSNSKAIWHHFFMHDAPEAYTGDMITPLKKAGYVNIEDLTDRIYKALYRNIGLALPTAKEHAEMKRLDVLSLIHEIAVLIKPPEPPPGNFLEDLLKLSMDETAGKWLTETRQAIEYAKSVGGSRPASS